MKIRPSNAEIALVAQNEYGGRVYDLSKLPRAPETLDSMPGSVRKRATGEEISGAQWDHERQIAHEFCGASGTGDIQGSASNVAHLLRLHPYWRGALRFNKMRRTQEFVGQPVTNTFATDIIIWFASHYRLRVAKSDAWDGLEWACEQNGYHPVELYLGSLKWDKRERLHELCKRVGAKTDNTELYSRYFRKWMFAAVKRVLEPGCKFDNMLVLYGRQGFRKSSFFRALAGQWFNDSPIDIEHSQNLDIVNAAWIHEFAELESVTSRADVGRLKAFLTTSEDRYRPPYERKFVVSPRQSVSGGTTNDADALLRDPTGSRRFWVVEITKSIDVDWVIENRDQLWAEALELYLAHGAEQEWLEVTEATAQAEANEVHEPEDPWTAQVAKTVAGTTIAYIEDVLKDLVDKSQADMRAAHRVGAILRGLGWVKTVRTVFGVRRKCWALPASAQQANLPF